MKKGGTTEFRKVAFYPSRKAIETAAANTKVCVCVCVCVYVSKRARARARVTLVESAAC